MNSEVTFRTYLADLAATSRKHGGELAAAAACVIVGALAAVWSGQPLVVLVSLAAVLLYESAITTWRLYHRQQCAQAAVRQLLDLNAGDRADLEADLHARYAGHNVRVGARHAAEVATLSGEIELLETEAAGRARRRIAG